MKYLLFLSMLFYGFTKHSDNSIPIYFAEYGVIIYDIPKLGDTLNYNKSSKEDFRFVFFDFRGQCYFERFINGRLYQKGYYANSLDTLKRYVSGRNTKGESTGIKVQKYFEPIKNGEWITFKSRKKIKEAYIMGILK